MTVAVDDIDTTQGGSRGIVASGRGRTTVTADTVQTLGDNADGISAEEGNFILPGAPATVVGTSVTVNSVSTAGSNSTGIIAFSENGHVVVDAGTVTTSGNFSTAILAIAAIGNVRVTSDSVSTTGTNSVGIEAQIFPFPDEIPVGSVVVDSGVVATRGDGATGIAVSSPTTAVTVNSATLSTTGVRADGIDASTTSGPITINSGTVTTGGNGSTGILAETAGGAITITSASIATTGNTILGQPNVIAAGAHGIEATSTTGSITIGSTSITTGGTNANGIVAESTSGVIGITSGTIRVADGQGIEVRSGTGDVTVRSTSVTTLGGLFSDGIIVQTTSGDIAIVSGTASVVNGVGLFAITDSGDISITSTQIVVSGDITAGISASGDYYTGGDIDVVSGSVQTTGRFADAITVSSPGALSVQSTSITTTGEGARGIVADSSHGGVTIDSGTIATTGVSGRGIKVNVYYEAPVVIRSGTVTTTADNGDGIVVATLADSSTGDFSIASTSVSTRGHRATGIYAYHAGSGDIVVTSGTVTTAGDTQPVAYGGSHAIELHANTGSVTVTSTTVQTGGAGAGGIIATSNTGAINITSGTVTTAGQGATGIFAATGPGATSPEAPDTQNAQAGPGAFAPAAVAAPPDISITSGSVTTGGADSAGIFAETSTGDVEVISTGTVTTTGANSDGIVADSDIGTATVDAAAINVSGAGSDAIVVNSIASAITIRGLTRSTQGFAVQADRGPATIGIVAGGTLRGRVDLTEGVDRINNAGTFDAIGTSLFGGGADVFTNTGITRSVNGPAVLTSVDTFSSSGRIEMNDGAANDRLTIGGTYNGLAGSRLALDVDFAAGTADVLVTGLATGTTAIEAITIGQSQSGFTSGRILLVDAAAGTQAGAFTLVGGSTATSNAYVTSGLVFDAATFDFLLANSPNQAVFETAVFGEINAELWTRSADAVSAQLEAARDGGGGGLGQGMSMLRSGGRLGGWAQLVGANRDRVALQTFGTTVFDVTYEQDYQGLQAGLDHQSDGLIFGVTLGLGRSEVEFETSLNTLELESTNLGAYAQLQAGSFFANALVKVDWIDAETDPGPGLATEFDATSIGIRGAAGFRFDLGRMFAEPSVSLSWNTTEIADFTSGGATVAFDDATSLRGSIGIRVGGDFAAGSGTLSPSLGIHAFEEFEGGNRNDFTFGSAIALEQEAPGTFGRATAGLTYRTDSLEAFVRGELDFGGEIEGRGGRLGLRLRF